MRLRDGQEFGNDKYKLLYLKQTTNKILLYSTGNSAQCYTAAGMKGEFGGKWIHVYVWLSPFAVHPKQSQHCIVMPVLQYKISLKLKKKIKLVQWERMGEEIGGRDSQGVWEGHVHTAIFKMNNQQGPTARHMELCSMLCGSLYGSGVWGRMDP